MSRRGRRRNSKRRKSSSSSKQSVSPCIFQKQCKSSSVCYKHDIVEKGESDSLRKENDDLGSEDEEKYNNAPPKEKRFKQDFHVKSFPHQKNIYTKTTEDKEKGVKIVTSVSVSDVEDSSPKIMFHQTHEPLSENPNCSSTPVANTLKINCTGSHVKLEIQEILQLNMSDMKTTFVFMNENGSSAEMVFKSKCESTWMPNNESPEQPSQNVTNDKGNQNTNYRFAFGSISEQTHAYSDTKSVSSSNNPNSCQCCSDHKQQISEDFMFANHPSSPPPLLNNRTQRNGEKVGKSFSSGQFWDIPPPREFEDLKSITVEDLTHDLAFCRIGTCSPADKNQREFHSTHTEESRADLVTSFDHLSELDNYEPLSMRPSLSTNRSSLTKDFINCQKRKSVLRNNSIATVEHRKCLLPKKRRQTFPGMSQGRGFMQEDLLLPHSDSLSSLIMCSFPLKTERLRRIHQGHERFSAFGIGNYISSQTEKSCETVSEIPGYHDGKQPLLSPLYVTSSEDNPDDMLIVNEQCQGQQYIHLKQTFCKDIESLDPDGCEYIVSQSEAVDCGFDQEIGEVENHSTESLTEVKNHRALAIQVIPPSCSGSEEQILQNHSDRSIQNNKVEITSQKQSGFCMSQLKDLAVHSLNTDEDYDFRREKTGHTSPSLPQMIVEANDLLLDTGRVSTEDSDRSAVTPSCPDKGSTDTGFQAKELLSKIENTDKQTPPTSSLEAMEHLKPHKDPENSSSDHWAKRRKLFKESRQWSSAGGSSITSDITEESVSEDTHSVELTVQDSEDRGFYTETFHSSAWIYQGDDVGSGAIHSSHTTRTQVVSIQERTVKIRKGTGEYPWGFRIQYSKPIVVTEVDTNGAAEEAGLMVGDYVQAVNGIDVTSIPHSEAADLARQGPDVLTLTIGSDIACGPNTPRPACRGYLHKRTQSGLIKGWRKRWFVLTHDCCLYYYRHKRDEGKRRALSAIKLEGAEVGLDVSLGKPFVFKCRPQSGNRVYFLCATSNQEMKRWLDAMEKAIHPITQNHVWVDVTRHNSNLPPLAVKNPDCLGLLHKMNKSKDTWVQHYCILKDGCLYLYSGIRATHAHGGIYLQGYIVREQPYGSKKSILELKPPSDEFKTFYLCAENPNENKRWITAIKASIKKWLPLHQALQDYMNRPREETRM
ncbi:uncharacterized protein pdzph1 isoform X2 [Amphiprion ocellaris]|uniref:uncharacterized protein pdzph1 isoform X2 n=1 Tax=Amphiprion ocellaris TaxID=80972 RepID=UPI002410E82D|nr:uncharacterized protein pdzph1 isoform X2 [Amphiprion ocellaris]